MTSPSGLVFPIETIVRELDRLGVDTLVDAAHAPGMVPVDVAALGAAYWTGNGHKWLCGPKGAGVLVRARGPARRRPAARDEPRPQRPADRTGRRCGRSSTGRAPATRRRSSRCPRRSASSAASQPGGWPAHMAANRAMALDGRATCSTSALGLEPIAPESMVGVDGLGRACRSPSTRTPPRR